VVEGVGDHGCEYMTGGRAVILGPTGRNFAAGMSGGVAYVLDDEARSFARRCNKEMVTLSALSDAEEISIVHGLISRHAQLTGSKRAEEILASWTQLGPLFVRVMPNDYARVLEAQKKMLAQGLSQEEAEMAAFSENSRSGARLGGK
jgi:glutamate synthase (NADPH) large chain